MRRLASFRPKAAIAVLILGGVLLAPVASHGCQARGASLQEDIPQAGIQAPLESQTAGALLWDLSPSGD